MDQLFRAFFHRVFRTGHLTVALPSGRVFRFGDGSGNPVAIALHDRQAVRRMTLDPSMALGELYMDRRLTLTDGSIYDFLALVWLNLGVYDPPGAARALAILRHATRAFAQLNFTTRARRNVHHHYDLDRRLYDLFLDEDRQYSCAYFTSPHQSLDAAQLAKKRHIASKLALEPGHRVLDIGSGWGGLALYLAETCEARVTGVTLSEEQFNLSRERARTNPSVEFLLQDYRDLSGCFDRIVSVGMFEHVGQPFYDAFFKKSAALLDRDGVMLLHTIGRIDGPGPTNPWMAKYIFPGGYVPGLSEIIPAIERAQLIVSDVEILRLHYAETLRAWRDRFLENRAQAKALYDDRFCRMWEYYLAACETAFRFGNLVVFQIQIVKHLSALPITRSYMAEAETSLERTDRRQTQPSSAELPLVFPAQRRTG